MAQTTTTTTKNGATPTVMPGSPADAEAMVSLQDNKKLEPGALEAQDPSSTSQDLDTSGITKSKLHIHVSCLRFVALRCADLPHALLFSSELYMGLGLLDRLLAPLVLIFMIVGTAVGATTGDAIPRAFDQVQLKGVSFRELRDSFHYFSARADQRWAFLLASAFSALTAIVIGLLVMMWPVLTKVQYERLPELVRERKLWYQIGISLILNWVIGTR